MRIEKIMCPHILLQHSSHRDHLFLAGREPRQRSLGPLLWHGAPVGSGAAQNAHGSQSKHKHVCSGLQGTANWRRIEGKKQRSVGSCATM